VAAEEWAPVVVVVAAAVVVVVEADQPGCPGGSPVAR
jgi:hypothetical protein